jgi:lipopolysaccharide biosynthesis glycosyltransferase
MTTSTEAIQIATASDRSYLPWCATALLSCLRATTDRPLHFHVLHEGTIGEGDQDRLTAMVERYRGTIEFKVIDDELLGTLPTKGPSLGGRISWARVLLPEIFPGLSRVIYLDADVLTVQSLSSLWAEDLGGAVLGAVRNVVEPAMWPHIASLGISDPARYFNAGVLLIDLAAMRDARSWGRISEFVRRVDEPLTWFDQDALNVVFADRWKPLDPRWNVQNSFWGWRDWAADVFGDEALGGAVQGPAILHFEGPSLCKPWHYLCTHPYRDRYLSTLADTPWAGEPLSERTVANRLIRRLPPDQRIPAYLKFETIREQIRQAGGRARRAIRS